MIEHVRKIKNARKCNKSHHSVAINTCVNGSSQSLTAHNMMEASQPSLTSISQVIRGELGAIDEGGMSPTITVSHDHYKDPPEPFNTSQLTSHRLFQNYTEPN